MDNFIVRPKRLFVERYSDKAKWETLEASDADEVCEELAGLPSQLRDTEEDAKQFDLLLLSTQLALLNAGSDFDKLKAKVRAICHLLELQDSIPAVRAQMQLIQAIATDEWWKDVTVRMLENARKGLRLLIKLIEKAKRPIIYTNFEDVVGDGQEIALPLAATGLDYERFKEKARQFIKQHESHMAIQRLRRNKPITGSDLAELETMLLGEAGGDKDLIARAKQESTGLGLFIRSLVGLERQAAVEAMDEFLKDKAATANQLQFVNMIVDYLTKDGAMKSERLYDSPFTDFSAAGPDRIFPAGKLDSLFKAIDAVRTSAVA
jgi:type I restriction enzyme R subunit